jgi:hypothetical protein
MPQAGRGNAFTQSGNDASGDEDVFGHDESPFDRQKQKSFVSAIVIM